MAAIRALEARSVEMMREKAEKRKLERRIAMLRSQMLGNFDNIKKLEEIPEFRNVQQKIHHQYAAKLAELEKERESIEEEKAQVERYKQLLLKQRDIMIALTQRLNERDEQIVELQEELDAYDQKLDEKTAQLIEFTTTDTMTTTTTETESQRIAELERIVKQQKDRLKHSEAAMEQAQAEKMTMQSLLQERLEKLVQSEIESRLENGEGETHGDKKKQVELKRKISELETRLSDLRDQHTTLRDEMARRLEEKDRAVYTHTKERDAIMKIMDSKIRVLVENAALAAEASQGQRLRKELNALKRLVNASVTALKNSGGNEGAQSGRRLSKSTPLRHATTSVRKVRSTRSKYVNRNRDQKENHF